MSTRADGFLRVNKGRSEASPRKSCSGKAPQVLAQLVAQAQACGLTLTEAKELAAVQVGVAANIAANPHRKDEILLAADRATTDAVMAILARRVARAA